MITHATRRKAYEEILETLDKRQRDVLNELSNYLHDNPHLDGLTARELAQVMHKAGYFPTPERNFVHPRLTELVQDGHVVVVGKRRCDVTGKTCAVYRVAPTLFEGVPE